MKRLRWRRIIVILVVLVLFGAGLNFSVHFLGTPKKTTQPEASQTTIEHVDKVALSDTQKKEIIENARNQAIEAARSSGQTEEEAQKFGDLTAKITQESLNSPVIFHQGQ